MENISNIDLIEVPTYKDVKTYLRRVRVNDEDLSLLAKWRKFATKSFFTWIKPSKVDMSQWLKEYKDSEKHHIFILERSNGVPIGQMALYNTEPDLSRAEFGYMIRGDQKAPKGLMTIGASALLRWGFEFLGLEEIYLMVFSDNIPAIKIYKRLGFKVVSNLSYVRKISPNKIVYWEKYNDSKEDNNIVNRQITNVYKMILSKSCWAKVKTIENDYYL